MSFSGGVSARYLECVSPDDPELNSAEWPGWRGVNRDARVEWLPESLPEVAEFDWTAVLAGEGLGGVAAAAGYVVVGSRDALDRNDVFQCFHMDNGKLAWQRTYPAVGRLDYGNAPRATPLIHGEYVYTLGAFGQLCCLELETGIMLWQVNVAKDFGAPKMIWGHSGSPVLAGEKLILQPGGKEASIVALDSETGDVVWQSSGIDPSYSSLLLKTTGEIRQVIGYDSKTLGGWDVETGRRLWTLVPSEAGDFNVPTVVPFGDRLLVSSENNGTRLHHFNPDGTLHPVPDAVNPDLKPDCHTPVVSGGRIFGIWNELLVLDPVQELKTTFRIQDDAFAGYGCLIASDTHLLALSDGGELLLIESAPGVPRIVSRLKLQADRRQVLSHPAISGKSLYIRMGKILARLRLD